MRAWLLSACIQYEICTIITVDFSSLLGKFCKIIFIPLNHVFVQNEWHEVVQKYLVNVLYLFESQLVLCAIVSFLPLILPWLRMATWFANCQQIVAKFQDTMATTWALCVHGDPKTYTVEQLTQRAIVCLLFNSKGLS